MALLVVWSLFCLTLFFFWLQTKKHQKTQLVQEYKPIPGETIKPDEVPCDQYFVQLHKRYGDIYSVTFLGEKYVVLAGREAIDFFKQHERNFFQVKGSSPESWNLLYGENNPILTSSESAHRLFRKATTNQMMSLKATISFYPFILAITERYLEKWLNVKCFHSEIISKIAFSISWVWVLGDRGSRAEEMFHLFEDFVVALSSPVESEAYKVGLIARGHIIEHLVEIFNNPPSERIPNLFSTFSDYISQDNAKGSEAYTSRLSDLLVGILFAAYHALTASLHGSLWELGTNQVLQNQLRKEYLNSLKEHVARNDHSRDNHLQGYKYRPQDEEPSPPPGIIHSEDCLLWPSSLAPLVSFLLVSPPSTKPNTATIRNGTDGIFGIDPTAKVTTDSNGLFTDGHLSRLPFLPYETLNHLPLLNGFVSEVLRLYNSGFGIYRLSTNPFTFQGYLVEQDTKIFLFCGYDHYNVPTPHSFDLSRDQNTYTWLPFGVGTRSCMGQKFALSEIKAFIVQVISKFRIEIDNEKVIPARFPEFNINDYISISPLK
eukprot:TRINITY_DN12619_c0_g1_i5.p1 TRINITY_DN12619_c0_g1~~TRINITY_DN12619_c0_g1_i5.p1  ORF type:complete len:562 (-),score=102.86 TRINITY_DN12619_c0_g1_i5:191-1825(-)